MSDEIGFGPWPKGIDNLHRPNAVQVDQFGRPQALVDALNVDIDYVGYPASRLGQTLHTALPGAHSIATLGVGTFCVAQGVVYMLNGYTATAVGSLLSDDPCSWDDFQGGVVVSNRTSLFHIRNSSNMVPLCVTDGAPPVLAPTGFGGMLPGRYSVAVAYVRPDGIEGALSDLQTVTVPPGGGLSVTVGTAPDAALVRIYRTDTNGMVLMRAADTSPGSTMLIGSQFELGKEAVVVPEARAKAMPPGDFVNYWRGRLLIARGRTLYFSEPWSPHLGSKVYGFVQFSRKINFVRGMMEGVYVGTREDVWWLPGEEPRQWKQVSTGGQPAANRGSALVDGADLDKDYQLSGQNIAVWLSTSGFVLGTPNGQIIEPQADRFQNVLPQQASIALNQRRLTAVIQ